MTFWQHPDSRPMFRTILSCLRRLSVCRPFLSESHLRPSGRNVQMGLMARLVETEGKRTLEPRHRHARLQLSVRCLRPLILTTSKKHDDKIGSGRRGWWWRSASVREVALLLHSLFWNLPYWSSRGNYCLFLLALRAACGCSSPRFLLVLCCASD